jgi:ribosomal protein S18 acetylase RimI-like enzyme
VPRLRAPIACAPVIEVRPVRADEHAALGSLTRAAYAELFDDLDADGYGDELADVAGRAVEDVVLVAVDGAAVLGGVTYVPGVGSPRAEFADPDAAGIRMLAVDPAGQGRGAGRALVLACLERARAAGRLRVVLHTLPVMAAARHLYEDLGFVRDPSLDIPDPTVELLLAYRLEL